MSKIIDMQESKRRLDKLQETERNFSSAFRGMFINLYKQAHRELGDKLLTVTAESFENDVIGLSKDEKLELFLHLIEELKEVVDSMEYMISHEESPAEVISIDRSEDE